MSCVRRRCCRPKSFNIVRPWRRVSSGAVRHSFLMTAAGYPVFVLALWYRPYRIGLHRVRPDRRPGRAVPAARLPRLPDSVADLVRRYVEPVRDHPAALVCKQPQQNDLSLLLAGDFAIGAFATMVGDCPCTAPFLCTAAGFVWTRTTRYSYHLRLLWPRQVILPYLADRCFICAWRLCLAEAREMDAGRSASAGCLRARLDRFLADLVLPAQITYSASYAMVGLCIGGNFVIVLASKNQRCRNA